MDYIASKYRGLILLLIFSLLIACGDAFAQMITVKPGQLASFSVSAPEEAISGEDFFLQIKAHDQYGNIITNYSDIGKSINLMTSGSQQLMPNTLSAISFIGGVATVKAVYKKAEDVVITVKDFSELATGKSAAIKVKPNTIHHFRINAPDVATAGSNFWMLTTTW
jgi:nitrate reductase NapAB chaperone NapD